MIREVASGIIFLAIAISVLITKHAVTPTFAEQCSNLCEGYVKVLDEKKLYCECINRDTLISQKD